MHQPYHTIIMPYILIYFLCLLRSKFWADRYSKNDLTFLLCKVIYRCKKAGARGIASAFEIFISSNCQRLLYSKGEKFHSINKASNGTRSYGEIAIKGSTEPIISRIFRFQQPLQNRVPGFVTERCRQQMQRGEDGAAVKIWRNTAIFWAPQEGLRSNFKSVCIPQAVLWG